MSTDYSLDQGAVDWARGEVEKVVGWCGEMEAKSRMKGDEEHAMRYRVAANVMKLKLISGGCVITAFSEDGPRTRRLLAEIEKS